MSALTHVGSTGFLVAENASAIEALHRQELINNIAASRGAILPKNLRTKLHLTSRKH